MSLIATPDTAIIWQDNLLYLLDQRELPEKETYLRLQTSDAVAMAITDMVVRGAPAIGVTAAFAVVLAAQEIFSKSGANWKRDIANNMGVLAKARPTAINLHWALRRMQALIDGLPCTDPIERLLQEAQLIHQQDIDANRQLSALGAELLDEKAGVMTHCNAGALATGGYGTALGVIKSAFKQGKIDHVYADETRPWFQGSRLTAWELHKSGIPTTVIADSAAASRMAQGGISWVIVGSDRIAANGDVANKIGTYSLIVNARFHGVKVMVAAPTSTISMETLTGDDIPIEMRSGKEIMQYKTQVIGDESVEVWNPVFDVTPAALIDAIVTEKGVVLSPNAEKIAELMGDG